MQGGIEVVKERLLELINNTENIETKIHDGGYAGIEIINDIQEFQLWIQELLYELQQIQGYEKNIFLIGTLDAIKKNFNGWNDKKDFNIIKGKLFTIKRNIDTYYGSEEPREMEERMKESKIFISHSSKDKKYVGKIVNLLDGMGLNFQQIFCSSIPGYDMPLNTNIFDFLREQFLTYNLHVIFVHSSNYYESPISLNEMGAAWALKNKHTSILLPEFEFNEMKGIVNNANIAIKIDGDNTEIKNKLNQLYGMIIDEFGITKKPDVIWEEKRDDFISKMLEISAENSEIDNTETIMIPQLSENAIKLLKTANADQSGTISKDSYIVGDLIQAGSITMNDASDSRDFARWKAALEELIRHGFVEDERHDGKTYQMTYAGYKYVDGVS